MATKQQIQDDLRKVYFEYQEIFNHFKINFLQWIDKFSDDYNNLRKASTYVFSKFVPKLKKAKEIWDIHPKTTWVIMLINNKNCEEARDLRMAIHYLKLIWQYRPKPPRKGSE